MRKPPNAYQRPRSRMCSCILRGLPPCQVHVLDRVDGTLRQLFGGLHTLKVHDLGKVAHLFRGASRGPLCVQARLLLAVDVLADWSPKSRSELATCTVGDRAYHANLHVLLARVLVDAPTDAHLPNLATFLEVELEAVTGPIVVNFPFFFNLLKYQIFINE